MLCLGVLRIDLKTRLSDLGIRMSSLRVPVAKRDASDIIAKHLFARAIYVIHESVWRIGSTRAAGREVNGGMIDKRMVCDFIEASELARAPRALRERMVGLSVLQKKAQERSPHRGTDFLRCGVRVA